MLKKPNSNSWATQMLINAGVDISEVPAEAIYGWEYDGNKEKDVFCYDSKWFDKHGVPTEKMIERVRLCASSNPSTIESDRQVLKEATQKLIDVFKTRRHIK